MDGEWLEEKLQANLPGASSEQLEGVKRKLVDLGVESPGDFNYVTVKDLEDIVPPIKARKLIASWNEETTNGEAASASNQAASQLLEPEEAPCTSGCDWSLTYTIPWKKLPSKLLDQCKNGQRPDAKDRRQMVRILTDDILLICPNPKRKQLRNIAQQIVQKYPQSFVDSIGGQKIGDGSSTLLQQMESRKENLLRSCTTVKPKKKEQEAQGGELRTPKKSKDVDSFGCLATQFQPQVPEGEALQRLNEKKESLQKMHDEDNWSTESIDEMMEATYCMQRRDIIGATGIQAVLQQWPFLIEERWMFKHFKCLTGIDIMGTLNVFLTKGSRLVKYFRSRTTPANLEKAVKEIPDVEGSPTALVAALPKLLAAYFKEDESVLIRRYDAMTTSQTVEGDVDLPSSPCVAVVGDDVYLCIDKKTVHVGVPSPEKGLLMAFAAFYVFNIVYPAGASSTLDFIQRIFIGINPQEGSKATMGRKKCGNVSGRVIKLVTELTAFESDWVADGAETA